MPFGISQQQSDCDTWATVKEESDGTYTTIGCHATKQDAIDQMVVVSMSEEIEPLGEVRAIDVDLSAPEFMRKSAKRGLVLHEEGKSGDGLMPATVADARRMADGTISEAKWRKIGAWISRHIVDLEAVEGDEITAGLVAMLLWGGGSSKASALRAQRYAEQIVARLDADEQRADAPAPKKDQIKGSDDNPAGSAADKTGGISIDDATEKALKNKVSEHNEKMAENDRPEWTRTTMGALKAVYRRGAGAFSGSHRPGIGRAQWAMARVNAFLYLCRTGRPENPNYKTDYDLLHKDHPKYSGSRSIKDDEIRCTTDERATMLTTMTTDATTEQTTIENRWCVTGQDERRIAYTTLEMRESGSGNTLVGYAAVFDSPSEPMPFIEYVKRGAFAKTINDGADVRLLIDHEGVPLARTRSGTLSLMEDDRGLQVTAELDPMNPDAARIISAMRRGDISQMSFAFRTIQDSWSSDRMTRELREVQLFDVSVVTFPAYEETVAELRSKEIPTTVIPTTSVSVRKAQLSLARHR